MKLVPFLCLFLLISTMSASLIYADQEQPPSQKGEQEQKSPPKKQAKKKKKKKLIRNEDEYEDEYYDEEDTCILEFPIEIPQELFDSARQVSQQQLI